MRTTKKSFVYGSMEKISGGSYIEKKKKTKQKKFVLWEDNHCFAYAQLEQWRAEKSYRSYTIVHHLREPFVKFVLVAVAGRFPSPGIKKKSVQIPGCPSPALVG